MKGIILTFLLSLAVCSQSLSAKDKITKGTTLFSQGIDRVVSHNWQYQKRLEPKVGVLVYGSLCACYALHQQIQGQRCRLCLLPTQSAHTSIPKKRLPTQDATRFSIRQSCSTTSRCRTANAKSITIQTICTSTYQTLMARCTASAFQYPSQTTAKTSTTI